jgi:hypothetical protein
LGSTKVPTRRKRRRFRPAQADPGFPPLPGEEEPDAAASVDQWAPEYPSAHHNCPTDAADPPAGSIDQQEVWTHHTSRQHVDARIKTPPSHTRSGIIGLDGRITPLNQRIRVFPRDRINGVWR